MTTRLLGFLRFVVTNGDLKKRGSVIGYLVIGGPKIVENVISEELLCACNFWMDYMVEIDHLGSRFAVALFQYSCKLCYSLIVKGTVSKCCQAARMAPENVS